MTGLHRTPLTTSQKVECAAKTLAQLERAVIALRVVGPNAIRPIEDLLPMVYPGVRVSYGTIQSILAQAEQQAKAFNAQADLGLIQAGALDERFSQGDPVLAGVDLAGGYLFSLALREGRRGEDWAEGLGQAKAQGLALTVVVKDAAKGLAAGGQAGFPAAEQCDDGCHVRYELNKGRRPWEQRAYAAIEHEQEAQQALGKIRAKDQQRRRRQKQTIARTRRQCPQAIARFDAFESAAAQVHEARAYVDLETGQWRSGQDVHHLMAPAAQAMADSEAPGCPKLAG